MIHRGAVRAAQPPLTHFERAYIIRLLVARCAGRGASVHWRELWSGHSVTGLWTSTAKTKLRARSDRTTGRTKLLTQYGRAYTIVGAMAA